MIRSVLAVAAGLAVLVALIVGRLVTFWFIDPTAMPDPGSGDYPGGVIMALLLAGDVLFAMIAGLATAFIARRAPVMHALALGALMAVLWAVVLFLATGQEPVWYQVARLVQAAPASLAGGYFRTAMRGRSSAR